MYVLPFQVCVAGGDLEFKSKKILEEGEFFDTALSSFGALFFPADHLGKHFLPLQVQTLTIGKFALNHLIKRLPPKRAMPK